MTVVPVFKITPAAQKYDWGKVGRESVVAQLADAGGYEGFVVDEKAPYAELWMGTHPTSPSHLSSTKQKLSTYLTEHPNLIGQKILDKFNNGKVDGNLPFLFKVLSIEKALSIQSHPDLETAKKLHSERPDVYKDPNHKPEMALAITPFEAMCGFLPLPLIAHNLCTVPELSALIPPTILSDFLGVSGSTTPGGQEEKKALRDVFAALMTAEEGAVKSQIATLVQRLNAKNGSDSDEMLSDVERLVIKLDSQFPGDVGVMCGFLLNYVTLKPGEAIFLGAGEPHAYVYGEIMECMANSDNVIRAGLTPKLRDVPNLISGLTYAAAPPSNHVVKPTAFGTNTTLYDPPIEEFSVLRNVLRSGGGGLEKAVHRPIDGPSIAIVVEGKGKISWEGGELVVKRGDVVFLGANVEIVVERDQVDADEMVLYRAFVEA